MTNTSKHIAPLPDEFCSEEEAAQFWDKHSLADYEQFLEIVDFEANVKRRHFEIEVDEDSFMALLDTARKHHKAVKQLASEILREKLTPV